MAAKTGGAAGMGGLLPRQRSANRRCRGYGSPTARRSLGASVLPTIQKSGM
jgi:hypothetical protein